MHYLETYNDAYTKKKDQVERRITGNDEVNDEDLAAYAADNGY